jgi:hypothetical protein
MKRQKVMRKSVWICMLCMQFAYAVPGGVPQNDVPPGPVSDADFCRNGLFPREQESLDLGVIQGREAEKVHFFEDLDGCPSSGAQCMRPSYVVPGDEVLVGKRTAEWACVWYQGRKREFVSWIPKKNVVLRPAPPIHPVSDWVGVWGSGPDKIRISVSKPKGELQIRSRLRWEGGTTPGGEAIAHYGGMTGTLEVHGSRGSAAEGDCQVTLARIGKYLVADDNGACGGVNVRHTGMYFRLPK